MREVKNILLVEDDDDDCGFFQEVIDEMDAVTRLIRLKDGMGLMELLKRSATMPHLIFLDINMPRKNGFQCLEEIRATAEYKELPVVIFSTTSTRDVVKYMFNSGANAFIVKPNDFGKWKVIIERAINMDWKKHKPHGDIENFLLA